MQLLNMLNQIALPFIKFEEFLANIKQCRKNLSRLEMVLVVQISII